MSLKDTITKNTEAVRAVEEALEKIIKGRKSRDALVDHLSDLHEMCDELKAAYPDQIEFIQPGPPQAPYYQRAVPRVLRQLVMIIVKLRGMPKCIFLVYNVALTKDVEAVLTGDVGRFYTDEDEE